MRQLLSVLVGVVAATLFAACGGQAGPKADQGSFQMTIGVAGAGLQANPTAVVVSSQVKVTVSGPFGFVYVHEGAAPLALDEHPCPVGSYSYAASADGSGGAKFASSGVFEVEAGAVTTVSILMQQLNAKPTVDVIAPYTERIEFALPGSSGAWGVPLKLTAHVTNPDNDKPDMDWFVYEWKHECAGTEGDAFGNELDGFFLLPGELDFYFDGWERPTAKVSTWFTSFCEGVETITLATMNTNELLCPDKGCALRSSVSFTVPYDRQGYGGEVTVNFAPVVECEYVNNAEPLPSGIVEVKSSAYDRDGDDIVKYEWTDSCGGVFAEPYANTTTWTAPGTHCTPCTLTLKATDSRDGYNFAKFAVKTAPADLTVGCVAPQ